MIKPPLLIPPPCETNFEGAPRHIGVELEFAAISAREGARKVQSLFGGRIEEEDPHRFHIRGTELGDFRCELDTQFAHRSYTDADMGPPPAEGSLSAVLDSFRSQMRTLLGDISSLIMPCEIVCPPIPVSDLARLEELVEALKHSGAEGTWSHPFYAFGAQLNPDVARPDAQWITSMLKAYLLLSDWLRAVMWIDPTRRLVAFADRFPSAYCAKVVNPDYWPSLETLIDDYLYANPTRNRELDMLPMFAWLDASRVKARITDPRVKSRPTFHYRLPDANLGVPEWGLTLEWNRWCVVERLAERTETLNRMGKAYLDNRARWIPEDWALKASEWLLVT